MRLIDADSINWDKCEDANGDTVYNLDKRDIDKQPTAYDVHEVMVQIGQEADNTVVDGKLGMYVYTQKVLDIVKEGGIC